MMAGLPQEFIDGNDEIFDTFGVTASLTRAGTPVYDPTTGGTTGGEPTTSELVVILGEREQTIENGAVKLIDTIEAKQELLQGDVIEVGSLKLVVIAVDPETNVDGNVLSFIADVEGVAQ